MLPCGGGKTSFFMELIKNPDIKFYGDDVALVDNKLEILPFPLRIGVRQEDSEKFVNIPENFIYEMERRKYGKKILLDSSWFKDRIAEPAGAQILLTGKRWNLPDCRTKKVGKIKMFFSLVKNLVIGIGLPQIIEYLNIKFFNLIKRALARICFSFKLLLRCECYCIYLGRDNSKNARILLDAI
jgi:hypothetical protein